MTALRITERAIIMRGGRVAFDGPSADYAMRRKIFGSSSKGG